MNQCMNCLRAYCHFYHGFGLFTSLVFPELCRRLSLICRWKKFNSSCTNPARDCPHTALFSSSKTLCTFHESWKVSLNGVCLAEDFLNVSSQMWIYDNLHQFPHRLKRLGCLQRSTIQNRNVDIPTIKAGSHCLEIKSIFQLFWNWLLDLGG